MSNVMSVTLTRTLRNAQRPSAMFMPALNISTFQNTMPYLLSGIMRPHILDSLSKNLYVYSSNVIRLPGNQQIREMSWGNVHTPMKRNPHRPNKHKDPRWKGLRKWKVIKIELPDREFDRKTAQGKVTPEEIRAELKLKGLLPPSHYQEAPVHIAATGAIFEEFNPPEGDSNPDLISKISPEESESSGWKDRIKEKLGASVEKAKSKTFRATRKIRTFDDNFDASSFGSQEAKEVYINAHKALAAKEEKRLHQLATEKAFPEMMVNTKGKSIYWDFVKSLEPPHVVQVRCQDVISKGNVFAQVTVRFHSQQILAVYDRFGRLIHGHPYVAKDVLEYVVFEKHLADTYGKWRIHTKIIPQTSANQRLGGVLTHVIKDLDKEESNENDSETKEEDKVNENERKYGVSYKSDQESVSIFNKFGKMIKG